MGDFEDLTAGPFPLRSSGLGSLSRYENYVTCNKNGNYPLVVPTMASLTSSIVFDDIFVIKEIDPDGKKFDRGMFKTYVFPTCTHSGPYSFPTPCRVKKLLHGLDVGL